MSVEIQKKKASAELARVVAARLEMEVKLCELEEAIERIKKEINIQSQKEEELKQKMNS
jgi:CII-binding regulator of phage lambda lysogenization HflD